MTRLRKMWRGVRLCSPNRKSQRCRPNLSWAANCKGDSCCPSTVSARHQPSRSQAHQSQSSWLALRPCEKALCGTASRKWLRIRLNPRQRRGTICSCCFSLPRWDPLSREPRHWAQLWWVSNKLRRTRPRNSVLGHTWPQVSHTPLQRLTYSSESLSFYIMSHTKTINLPSTNIFTWKL